jgi:uncharacterized protein (TIGR02001 family)
VKLFIQGSLALIMAGVPASAIAESKPEVEAGAEADAEVEAEFDLSANIGIVSDYRFRGISLSDRDPALQGGLDLAMRSGFFVGAWASTIADYAGAEAELDLYGGYRRSVAGLDLEGGAYLYLYPGGRGVNYLELQGTAGRAIGPVELGVELAWVPRQDNAATENLYFGATAGVAIADTGLTLNARGGRENGFYDDKWDWQAGPQLRARPVHRRSCLCRQQFRRGRRSWLTRKGRSDAVATRGILSGCRTQKTPALFGYSRRTARRSISSRAGGESWRIGLRDRWRGRPNVVRLTAPPLALTHIDRPAQVRDEMLKLPGLLRVDEAEQRPEIVLIGSANPNELVDARRRDPDDRRAAIVCSGLDFG